MPVIQVAEQNRRELQRLEGSAVTRLVSSYQPIIGRLTDKITTLESEVALLAERGNLSVNKVRQLTVYGSLLQQIEEELNRYGVIADNEITLASRNAIATGLTHSRQLTQSYFEFNDTLNRAFAITWDNLPVESIETMLGFLREDSPLHTSLRTELGENGARLFGDNLLEGIALGYNPNKVARLAQQSLGQPLTWAVNAARTSQIYAYREATRANYLANSEIVDGWVWFARLDGVACLSCVNNHGKSFELDKSLNDHHQGRCVPLPKLPDKYGITQPTYQNGEHWFNSLPESQRIAKMGRAKYNAYQSGEFRFSELSEVYQNDIYGEMQKEASLVGILGDRARNYYVRP